MKIGVPALGLSVSKLFIGLFVSLGCDDLVSAVFELAKSLSRLQMSDEEMALFSATVLLSPGDFTFFELNRLVHLSE